jgi:hypothetical protein
MGYRVQIRPFLLTEGEFKGRMEYIHFHVFLNGVEVGRWSETNIGQLPDSLGKLVGSAKAIEYDRILRTNIEVTCPANTPRSSFACFTLCIAANRTWRLKRPVTVLSRIRLRSNSANAANT